MSKLKEAYDIKRELVNENISSLYNTIQSEEEMKTELNRDDTIYVESDGGLDSIENTIIKAINNWCSSRTGQHPAHVVASMVVNTLPLNNNSCILHI